MSDNEPTSDYRPERDASSELNDMLSSGSGATVPTGSGDMLSSRPGDMLADGSTQRPRRNLAAIVVSLVAVLAVIGGGVAYVGYHKLASSGAQPDEWAPASSIAYVKLDLDPAASEKIAALRFEQKFPDAPHVTSVDALKDALLSEAFDQPSSNIDYATDIKPWLGNRVAVAAYPDASGKIQPIGILQIKDATQAQAGLAKLIHPPDVTSMSKAGFAIENGYAIVGPSQAAVDAAVAAAQTSSITASNQYASDVATLGGDRIVTAWADLGAVEKYAAKAEASELSNINALSALGSGGGALGDLTHLSGAQGLTNQLKGRLVVGLSLQSGYASISGRIVGGDVSGVDAQNADAGTLLGQLPAGSVAGIAASGIGPAISKEVTMLEAGPFASMGLKADLDAASAQLGISLPGDAINLIGNGVAIGLDSVPADGAKAKFTGIAEPTNVASGLKTAQALTGLLSSNGFPATATASGSKVIVTNDAGATGTLSNDPGFKAAMSGMPAQVVAAGYVDLANIWPSAGSGVPADLQHLTSIGTYEAIDGSDVTFSVRITVN
jgi:hypothetical protein